MSIAIQRQGDQERPQEQPTVKLNKSLLLTCDELVRIADSLNNDTRIKATARGVNAINREFDSNINLQDIRKLNFANFKNKFGSDISPHSVASELRCLAKKVRAKQSVYDYIGGLANVERALKISLISHFHNKTSLVKYMRQNKLKFKDGYSLK